MTTAPGEETVSSQSATVPPAQPADVLLSVRGLKVEFFGDEGTTTAVDGASFDLRFGKTLGIVGESGCGKSVTARSIMRLIERPGRITGGRISLRRNDEIIDIEQLSPNGRTIREVRGGEIGLVFQEPMTSFSPVHTLGDQLVEAVMLHSDSNHKEAVEIAVDLLKTLGMPRPRARLDEYPWQLSGGLRQRAMIAMALAGEPNLLIADEPTTALDVTTQAQILDLFRQLQDERQMAIMLITHDLGVIAQMADDVAVMYLGRIVEEAPVDDIFYSPQHPYTLALLESIPSIEARPKVKLPTILGAVPHPLNRPEGCTFHPRCPQMIPGNCDIQEPVARALNVSHAVTCHLFDDLPVSKLATELADPKVAS